VARTSREGDRVEPAALTAGSVTLRNGACHVLGSPRPRSTSTRRTSVLQPESNQTAGAADRSHPLPRAGGPRRSGTPAVSPAVMRRQAARRGCRWSRTRDLEGRPGSRRWPTSTGRTSDQERGCTPRDAPRAEPALGQAGRREEEPNPSPAELQVGAPTRLAIAPDRGAATTSPQVHDANEALRTECPEPRAPRSVSMQRRTPGTPSGRSGAVS
jgi:hypothetical protein